MVGQLNVKKLSRNNREIQGRSIYIMYAIVSVVFALFALSYLYILVWAFIAGLSTHTEINLHPFAFPAKLNLSNYIEVFRLLKVNGVGFLGMLWNSLYFSVLGSFIGCMVTAMIAYVTCKYKFPGSKIFYPLVVIMMSLPIYGTGGSMYKLLFNLGWISSPLQILLATSGLGVNYLYFFAAFSSVSNTYSEAAQLDGAGDYTIFFKVIFPQVLPLFGSLFVIAWVADWNNYSSVLLYLPKMPTLAGGIYMFELDIKRTMRSDILYAAYVVSTVPSLLLFVFCNKALTSNVSIGGIKE